MSTNNNNANNTNNTAASTKEQKPSLFFNQIDHISNRVTAMTLMGLIGGASLATFRALPIPRTSLTVAFSCALAGTACLIPERILHHSSFLWFERECEQDMDMDKLLLMILILMTLIKVMMDFFGTMMSKRND